MSKTSFILKPEFDVFIGELLKETIMLSSMIARHKELSLKEKKELLETTKEQLDFSFKERMEAKKIDG